MTDRELMQQALEALNRSDYLGWQLNIPIIKALRERLAHPVQEPVAWGVFDGPNLHDVNFTEEDAQEMVRLKGDGSVVKPLYTSPQPQMQPCAGRNCGSTNPNLHSSECFEDYEKATGMGAQQPGIEELEQENRLMRARNERLEAEVDRLERENFAWRTKLGVRGYEMQIEDLRAKLQGLLHYRSKP